MKKLFFYLLIFCLPVLCRSQLLNGDMENYTYNVDTVPEHWSVSSHFGTLPGRTTDAYSGTYAFVINSWYYYNPGWLVNGSLVNHQFLFDWIKAGKPITNKPEGLKGFYKYTGALGTDTALAQVILKKWNAVANRPDTIGYGIAKLPPVNTYTSFALSIHDYSPGVQPDSAVVLFTSHDMKNLGMPATNMSRYLYIDDVSFSFSTGIRKNSQGALLFTYFQNELMITNKENKKITARIYSVDGKLIQEHKLLQEENRIDVQQLPKGIYLVNVSGELQQEYRLLKE